MTQTESAQTVERSVESTQSRIKALAFLVAIILVNIAGLSGQAAGMYGQLVSGPLEHWPQFLSSLAAVLVGVAMESIGIYLMLQAHDATMANQASGSLRLAAYAVAGVMAALNYAHWSTWARALGVTFALFSMVSPYLWSVRSRSMHRAQQAARGIVDPAGVKLSTSRKFWHPLLSLSVLRWASWAGETDPSRAVSGWEGARSVRSGPVQAEIQIESAPEGDTLQIEDVESESDTETETVVETVTETKTVERRHSVSREQKRERVMRERVAAVQSAYPDWESAPVTYAQIKSATGLAGAETIKGIYHTLYPERVRAELSD